MKHILIGYGFQNRYSNTESTSPNNSSSSSVFPSSTSSTTFIIKGRKRALREAYNRSLRVENSYYCITGDELVKSYKPFITPLRDQVLRRGGSSLIITNIEKETFGAVKDLTEAGAEIRHIDISTLRRCVIFDDDVAYFSVVEAVIRRSANEDVDQTEGEDLWIGSTEPTVVQSAKQHFLADWRNAIPATRRINELEKGIAAEFLKVITDPEEATQILFNIAASAKKEVLSIMPSAKGMLRMERLGIIDRLIEASRRGAIVKIICPLTETNSHIVKQISEKAPDIRIMDGYDQAPSGILIADSEKFLQAELKDPSADQFSNAIGFALYSNSRRNVDSFKAFFELLWDERILNEELNRAKTMQKEFINIAAHELRTPVQPILSLSNVLHSKKSVDAETYHEFVDVIYRNAKRLNKLTEDILDVTKIEGKTLQLKKERIDLRDVLLSVVEEYQHQTGKLNYEVKLIFPPTSVAVDADREKLLRVIDNLLNNAIKFTKEGGGIISIIVEKIEDTREVIVKIKDRGIGLDSEILPRLFSRFASKSFQGTGLGLFISKGIIEAHGGRIWAANNTDGKGATLSFSLPINE